MQLLFKFQGLLLKPKLKIYFFWISILNSSTFIHINHLDKHSMINMALKWHHKNISNKITVFIKFRWLLDMFFGLFDCDYTHES